MYFLRVGLRVGAPAGSVHFVQRLSGAVLHLAAERAVSVPANSAARSAVGRDVGRRAGGHVHRQPAPLHDRHLPDHTDRTGSRRRAPLRLPLP